MPGDHYAVWNHSNFVALSLGVIAVLFAADLCAVERARPFLIGALNTSWGPTPQVVGLRDGLRQLGYRENEDFVIGVRFTQGDLTALPAAARQLVQDGVDIIFVDHDDGARAAQQATTQIPIVGVAVGDPRARTHRKLRPAWWQSHRVADLHLELSPQTFGSLSGAHPRAQESPVPLSCD